VDLGEEIEEEKPEPEVEPEVEGPSEEEVQNSKAKMIQALIRGRLTRRGYYGELPKPKPKEEEEEQTQNPNFVPTPP